MITLEKIRAEIEKAKDRLRPDLSEGANAQYTAFHWVLHLLDKYAEQEQTDEWQNGYDRAWEEAEVFYEKEEPKSVCDLCRYDYMDGVCGDCPAMTQAEWEREGGE